MRRLWDKVNPEGDYAMNTLNSFIELLEKLEDKKIHYHLRKTRNDAIMIDVSVPGQRWEIEYNTYGESTGCVIEIEKFVSDGLIYDSSELDILFRDFSD